MTIETLLVKQTNGLCPIFFRNIKNEMIFKTPLETKQETIPIEIIIKAYFFKIKMLNDYFDNY